MNIPWYGWFDLWETSQMTFDLWVFASRMHIVLMIHQVESESLAEDHGFRIQKTGIPCKKNAWSWFWARLFRNFGGSIGFYYLLEDGWPSSVSSESRPESRSSRSSSSTSTHLMISKNSTPFLAVFGISAVIFWRPGEDLHRRPVPLFPSSGPSSWRQPIRHVDSMIDGAKWINND